MLTYSLVDRGTVVITGLDRQTDDKARFQGQYYSDKLPGFSLLATVPYADLEAGLSGCRPSARRAGRLPYWAADYWVTLCTSGLAHGRDRRPPGLLVRGAWAVGRAGLRLSGSPTAWRRRPMSMPRSPTATRRPRLRLFASFFLLWKKSTPATARLSCSSPVSWPPMRP